MASTYQLIFQCQIAEGQNEAEVKKKLAILFKKNSSHIDKILAKGNPIVVKKGLSSAQAQKLQTTLSTRTGAVFTIEEIIAEHQPVQHQNQEIPSEVQKPPKLAILPTEPVPSETEGEMQNPIDIEERVGFGRRFIAWLLNIIIVTALGIPLGMVAGDISGLVLAKILDEQALSLIFSFFGSFIGAVFGIFVLSVGNILLEGLTGASIGKRLLKIKIASVDGDPAGVGQLLFRVFLLYFLGISFPFVIKDPNILFFADLAYVLFFIISCLFILGSSKRALHDRLLGTAVYKLAKPKPVTTQDQPKRSSTFGRSLKRIAILLIILISIPLAVMQFSPNVASKYIRLFETLLAQRESFELKKGKVYLLSTSDAQILLQFTQITSIDDNHHNARYRWRYKANKALQEKQGGGEVSANYQVVNQTVEGNETIYEMKDVGSQLYIDIENIFLEWLYGSSNSCWIFYNAKKVTIKPLPTAHFETYRL